MSARFHNHIVWKIAYDRSPGSSLKRESNHTKDNAKNGEKRQEMKDKRSRG